MKESGRTLPRSSKYFSNVNLTEKLKITKEHREIIRE